MAGVVRQCQDLGFVTILNLCELSELVLSGAPVASAFRAEKSLLQTYLYSGICQITSHQAGQYVFCLERSAACVRMDVMSWHPGGMDARRTETYLRLLAEAELQHAQTGTADGAQEGKASAESRAEDCLGRLKAAAGALVGAGVLDEDVASSVLTEFRQALAARSLIAVPLGHPMLWPQGVGGREDTELPAAVGSVRAIPVGRMVWVADYGQRVEVSLLDLVVGSGRAVVTMTARWPPAPESGPDGGRPSGGRHPFVFHATDDRGDSYTVRVSGRSGPDLWEGVLALNPVPPEAIRWLELRPVSGEGVVRVEFYGPALRVLPVSEDCGPVSAGERVLDNAGWALLAAGPGAFGELAADMRYLASAAAALADAGELPPASPALGRVVELCRQLGIELEVTRGRLPVRPPAAIESAPGGLPSAWADVLARRGAGDGRPGTASAAVVMPELGGVRFALAGLQSSPGGFTLRVLVAEGQLPQARMTLGMRYAEPFSWQAVDDAGRSHVGSAEGWDREDGAGELFVRFSTPLDPSAGWLEICVADDHEGVRVEVPLSWVEGS
jgi:hypothetical protein